MHVVGTVFAKTREHLERQDRRHNHWTRSQNENCEQSHGLQWLLNTKKLNLTVKGETEMVPFPANMRFCTYLCVSRFVSIGLQNSRQIVAILLCHLAGTVFLFNISLSCPPL